MSSFNTKFIFLDGEYGGVKSNGVSSHNFSILDLAFVVTDINLQVVDSLVLKIKPDDGRYIVSAEGLAANKINLIQHDKIAISHGKAKELLYNFIKLHSENGKNRLVAMGIGVAEDIKYLFDQKIISENSWRQYCSDQKIDFGQIIMLLKILGLYPQTVKSSTGKISNSLEALAEYLALNTKKLHEAKGDVDLYLGVCRDLFNLLKKHLPAAKLPFSK